MIRLAAIATTLGLLASCAPTLEEHVAACEGYGFRPGAGMAQCVQDEAQAWQANFQRAMIQGSQYMATQQALQQQQEQYEAAATRRSLDSMPDALSSPPWAQQPLVWRSQP